MVTFYPSSLKNELVEAIKVLDYLEGCIEDMEFDELLDDDALTETDQEIEICNDTPVCLYIGEDNYPYITVSEFISLAKNKSDFKINDIQSYAKSSKDIFFLLEISDYNTSEILYNTFKNKNVSALEKSIKIDDKIYTVCLFHGFSFYHLLVQESENYDDYAPAYSDYDYFIKVNCSDNIDMRTADSIATAYVFELQSSFNILLPFSNGRMLPFEEDRSDETLFGSETKMFPLIHGDGANELLSLYNTARNTHDIDFKILGFTKVVEYISPTIVQKELIEKVTLKLTSPSVFKPNANFIAELGAIYDKYRYTSTKDSELIKQSVLTAVALDEIWNYVPQFIKGKQIELPTEQECVLFLEKISDCIYDTRNEIAHAKANYEKKGAECPKKYKEDYCKMLELIAVRCIRWFALQPEDKRVVLK